MILIIALLFFILLINAIAIMHAYKFTHYDENKVSSGGKTKLTLSDKIKGSLFGVSIAKPKNITTPSVSFKEVIIKSDDYIHCWLIKGSSLKSIILFHGYAEDKSLMLERAELFIEQDYNVLLVDTMGTGSSKGNSVTIGYKEANNVKAAYSYMHDTIGESVSLYGVSMGSVAIMKAISDFKLPAAQLILECPFGSMLDAVKSRCSSLGLPVFPMALLLVYWGGRLNGFNSFTHNPTEYAKNISIDTLLLRGERDFRVSRKEIKDIYDNLRGKKRLKTYHNSAHESFLNNDGAMWKRDILDFIKQKKA